MGQRQEGEVPRSHSEDQASEGLQEQAVSCSSWLRAREGAQEEFRRRSESPHALGSLNSRASGLGCAALVARNRKIPSPYGLMQDLPGLRSQHLALSTIRGAGASGRPLAAWSRWPAASL